MPRGRTQAAKRLGPAALETYLRRMREIRETGGATAETSYYPALETLLNAVGASLDPKVHVISQLADTGAGLPDFGFYEKTSGALRGVVEAKPTNDDSIRTASGDQVVRYHRRHGLVLVTNYRDFLLVAKPRRGRLRIDSRYSLADSEEAFWTDPARRAATAHGERFFDFVSDVLTRAVPILRASDLAESLARYAREALFRVEAHDMAALEPLRAAMTEALGLHFREEEGERFFRSSLVQMLFYGLFSAWILWGREERSAEARFDWRTASDYLQLPLVDSLFEEIARPSRLRDLNLREPLEWAEAALNRVAREEFFRTFEEDQAIQYFYEPFVEAFDPALRDSLGVWYTPPEIVRYQVARVDALLREELDIPDGLADPRVVVLDPVVGTGSYLIEVLRTVHSRLLEKGRESVAALEVKKAATERVFGFEILPAPFVVAHLQLGLLLRNLGAALGPGERLGVYLTNSLTGWEPPREPKAHPPLPGFPELAREQAAAEHIKREEPILVILGNPPYKAFAGTAEEEEADLIAPYKHGLSDVWGVKRQTLDDLYIRFWRLGERRIAEINGRGVVSYISNNSWLEGGSHPVMREHLLLAFDQIWIDNLHGNRRISERAPNGRTCETIFKRAGHSVGIKVGTAIGCMVKKAESVPSAPAAAHYRDVWGRPGAEESWGRAEEKRNALVESLSTADFGGLYELLNPREQRRWVLVPGKSAADYASWPALPDVFPVYFNGVNTNRDTDLVSIDRGPLEARMRAYYDPRKSDEELKQPPKSDTEEKPVFRVLMTDAARFQAAETRKMLLKKSRFNPAHIVRTAYRPFDDRWLYYEPLGKLLNEKRPDYFAQVWDGNRSLVTYVKQHRGEQWDELLVSTSIVDYHCFHPNTCPFPLRLRRTELSMSRS